MGSSGVLGAISALGLAEVVLLLLLGKPWRSCVQGEGELPQRCSRALSMLWCWWDKGWFMQLPSTESWG